ncbi:MAG TPA: amidohydrolase family protein [Pseudonocardiaceae bacterium]|jgi:2,3-dihydroxybenzoate decarboxylase|nr:amidohydrolase family protein [Pseudonocardiaceae bacterium]
MAGKIGLEEHFNVDDFAGEIPQYVNPTTMKEINRRLLDVGDERIEEMDAAGIDFALLSMTSPGIQGELDPARAVTRARALNDQLAGTVAAHPNRFGGFAALPMQDPTEAAAELDRCVHELGFHGALLNGYTNVGDVDTGWYYDHERFAPVWEVAEALGTPIYLHPRDPMPRNQGLFEGHPELFGAVWTFTVETATHALRLMTSGLFDRYPKLTFILGHLGETLPFNIWRIDHRASYMGDLRKFTKPLTHYLLNNFYVTTSGIFDTQALNAAMARVGVDRVLYSSDYPYESMREASDWFDNAVISDNDRFRIGNTNARTLFPHLPDKVGKGA